ncbi:MAG: baseplate protein [Candidatus Jettenia sp.]|uniref:Putative phage baseplate lysozyme n=1 Tax=Candidatus Jettenia caeni TaxID=247490 RepID=I3IIA4_9BACT|nr:GPW/gp25 family protein [Candidatus Jettenia sp. AMX1]MBC6928312.1 baseplate protein [Candidatus Jettenia sp.]NUN21975.1 GPW/gp25 family protein [Candidatus Jettenia caeni]KAA0249927.1 MAG: baseplate protein [Candidatus Jettenia sp. AMX1]MCE7880405.1 baseplate protein [Candidatus Jettenia sp. AMX1]MCQ3926213.1 baseplate protein [Candidatus Jettenia sp.]
MNTDFIGKGFAFPLQINSRGGIQESRQEQKIKESILIILGTQHGERVMRPNFGCNLKSLVFEPNNTTTANLARHYVQEALTTWEPRIILEEVMVKNDNNAGRLMIDIRYRIKSTNEPQNMVYPFYLEQQ